jgi:hypothetical protein
VYSRPLLGGRVNFSHVTDGGDYDDNDDYGDNNNSNPGDPIRVCIQRKQLFIVYS